MQPPNVTERALERVDSPLTSPDFLDKRIRSGGKHKPVNVFLWHLVQRKSESVNRSFYILFGLLLTSIHQATFLMQENQLLPQHKKWARFLIARSLLNHSETCQEFLHLRIDLFFNPINVISDEETDDALRHEKPLSVFGASAYVECGKAR